MPHERQPDSHLAGAARVALARSAQRVRDDRLDPLKRRAQLAVARRRSTRRFGAERPGGIGDIVLGRESAECLDDNGLDLLEGGAQPVSVELGVPGQLEHLGDGGLEAGDARRRARPGDIDISGRHG